MECLFRKLEKFSMLSAEEREALDGCASHSLQFRAREDLIQDRKPIEGLFVIVSGFACRYRSLPDGRRQIVGYLLPGDMCDLRVFLLPRMDHSVCALNAVTVSLIAPDAVINILQQFPRLARAMWWTTLVEESIAREWVVNVGCRTAFERVAHLFCEIFVRMEAVGLTKNGHCPLPLTQTEIADSLALSSVHVNRTLMYMRRNNLVRMHGGVLEIPNRAELEAAAGFDRGYLHLEPDSLAPPQESLKYLNTSLR